VASNVSFKPRTGAIMQVEFTKDGKTELVKISSKAPPLLMILTTTALLLILQSLTVLLVQNVALVLTGLIAVNLVCGLWLLLVCAEQLMPTTLKLDVAGLTCQRLVTHKTYMWDDITALKLVAAGAVSDAPRTVDRGRIGVGLVLRAPTKATARDTKAAAAPTVVLLGADPKHAEKMLEIMETVQKFQTGLNAKPQERWKKAAQPQQQTQFRKKPNITMPA
jgi:hypothetical protein